MPLTESSVRSIHINSRKKVSILTIETVIVHLIMTTKVRTVIRFLARIQCC